MNVGLFFYPISEELIPKSETALGQHTDIYHSHVPNWRNAEIVILSVPEYRGSNQNNEERKDVDAIRNCFYQLKNNNTELKIADLGNLKPGPTLEDTYLRLQEVLKELMENNCTPLIIGGSHDLTYGQYLSFNNENELVHFVNIDSKIDFEVEQISNAENSFLENLFTNQPNHLYSYSHLGFQSFNTAEEELKVLDSIGFDCVRIGELKADIKEAEPYIRAGDFLSFDINAIKASDSPVSSTPFGFSAEEACQLTWYAGQNNQLQSFGIYGYQSKLDNNLLSAQIIATMMWYFIEGYYNRKKHDGLISKNFTKYSVMLDEEVVFYKDNVSDKWWLKIKDTKGEYFDREHIVPISPKVYEDCSNGIIPEKWFRANSKLN